MDRSTRDNRLAALPSEVFDVAVVGGGVHGGAAFRALLGAGYRVLLVERGDYACGTSQSSTMMAWGGLIYLKNGDLGTVWRLSRSRDELLARDGDVSLLRVRYLGGGPGAPPRFWERLALHLYWAMGGCRRRRPALESSFPEQELLRGGRACVSLTYEEGRIGASDARFVLRSILQSDSESGWSFNYCRLQGGGFDPRRRCWQLELEDRLTGRAHSARARWVVNAAGVGTDRLNASFGVEAPYRHLFSKGVFITLPRHPAHDSVLAFDSDFLSWGPWGPCALWGPTETVLPDLDAASAPDPDDVYYLLGELNRYTRRSYAPRDVISLRCGVRPIAVRRDSAGGDSRQFSRRARLVFERERPWVSVYGGNITYAPLLARRLLAALRRRQTPTTRPRRNGAAPAAPDGTDAAPRITFPGLPGTFPAPGWCAAREECWHLEDYLRRRTNIAQWVPRAGLGAGDMHRPLLERLARAIYAADGPAHKAVEEYALRSARDHQWLLEESS